MLPTSKISSVCFVCANKRIAFLLKCIWLVHRDLAKLPFDRFYSTIHVGGHHATFHA
jgi:hypothetical protein